MRTSTRDGTGSVGGRLRVWIRWEKKLPEQVSVSPSAHMIDGELTNER